MEDRYIKVFRKDIAIKLMLENYKMIGTIPNKHNKHLSVFLFRESDEINARLEELIHM